MLSKLIDFVTGREPVATATGIAAVITAGLGLGATFGLAITVEQIAAVGALAAALAGWVARRVVTPVAGPTEHQDRGSIPLAVIVFVGLIVVLALGLALCGDALFQDESEKGDLGIGRAQIVHSASEQKARTEPADHECWDYGDCGDGGSGGNTGYDGEGGRSGDMDQGGDDNCRNFCDNIIYIPSPGGGGEERPR
jgi:hypothetical protein